MLMQNIEKCKHSCISLHRATFCKITQLSSVESHCVDGLSGPEDSMKPSSCNSNNCPAFQGLRKHLDPDPLETTRLSSRKKALRSVSFYFFPPKLYLFRDMSWGRRRRQAQLVKSVEAKSVNVAFFCQHHRVVFSSCYLGAVVRRQALHHPRNLRREAKENENETTRQTQFRSELACQDLTIKKK